TVVYQLTQTECDAFQNLELGDKCPEKCSEGSRDLSHYSCKNADGDRFKIDGQGCDTCNQPILWSVDDIVQTCP
ncbi:MAG: hypothetical protein SGILL_006357, partial [Bacillariaceae sp.]